MSGAISAHKKRFTLIDSNKEMMKKKQMSDDGNYRCFGNSA
jgi:hypothetical protein